MEDLSAVQKFGVHRSGLTLDFRSNRINTGKGFFLALTCTLPPAAEGSRRKRQYNGWWLSRYFYDQIFAEPTCTPSQTLTAIVGRDQDEPLKTADEYFVRYYDYLFTILFVHSLGCEYGAFLWLCLIMLRVLTKCKLLLLFVGHCPTTKVAIMGIRGARLMMIEVGVMGQQNQEINIGVH